MYFLSVWSLNFDASLFKKQSYVSKILASKKMRFCFVVKLWCTSTLDVQPPLVEHCLDDIRRTSSERFVNITWKAPDFYDRFGHNVHTSSNYPKHGSSFFWGDYTVEYNALKPFNGLWSNCTFNITVRRKLTFSAYEVICSMFLFLSFWFIKLSSKTSSFG